MKLSILIPSTPDRKTYMELLFNQFSEQLGESEFDHETGLDFDLMRFTYPAKEVEVIIYEDNYENSIGYKRNKLLQAATGEYVAFIDSDDRISDHYFKNVLEGINNNVDCCSLKGIITEDGKNPLLFEHSIKYRIYRTITDSRPGEVHYERYPNHLNCIRASIAKQFIFPEKNHGEDTDFATAVYQSGLIKTEQYIDEVIYYYDYRSRK